MGQAGLEPATKRLCAASSDQLSYWPTKTAVCRTWTTYKYTKKSEKSKSFCRNYFVRRASNLRSMNSSSIAGWNSGSL